MPGLSSVSTMLESPPAAKSSAELHHAEQHSIQPVCDELTSFPEHISQSAGAIVCMGDTITHLESMEAVEQLLNLVSQHLASDGVFCVSFRDYFNNERKGIDRWIPVRSSEDRILTCFLEHGKSHVDVYDVLHERKDCNWETSISAYKKLRLCPNRLTEMASRAGLQVSHSDDCRGMHFVAFAKSQS